MNVLFYVDDSQHWHPAARAIGRLVRATQGRVAVLTTLWTSAKREEAIERAKRHLALPDGSIDLKPRGGLIENVVPEEARDAKYDLVVLGRLGSLDWLTNGLIAHLVVRRTRASTLIMRGKAETVKSVLVTTQGAEHGLANVRLAAAIARAFKANVTVLHVLSQFPLTHEGELEMETFTRKYLETDAPEASHLRACKALLDRLHVEGTVRVRVGLVVEEILDEITQNGHDLLALGAHRTGGREGFLYQDIAGLLVRASPVSVLVVRDPGLADEA